GGRVRRPTRAPTTGGSSWGRPRRSTTSSSASSATGGNTAPRLRSGGSSSTSARATARTRPGSTSTERSCSRIRCRRMPDRWATFDCYGTLIDWNAGIRDQLERLFGVQDAPRLLERYHELEPQVQAETH